jgi:YesN/AraC family two-component response regulator
MRLASELGAANYLVKPIDTELLKRSLLAVEAQALPEKMA